MNYHSTPQPHPSIARRIRRSASVADGPLPTWHSIAVFAAVAIIGGTGCDNQKSTGTEGNAQSTAAPSGSEALGLGSAAASATAEPPADPLFGTWTGNYNATKGEVVLDKKVGDKTWKDDDGTTQVGKGTITLEIGADGKVEGKSHGALGPLVLHGKSEEDMVRITVMPEVPTVDTAMTGVFIGQLKEEIIKGRIRVAGPDATIVRESDVELKKSSD